jgi:hypothetical protein
MSFRKDLNYPELLKEYLEGEKISYLGVEYNVYPANINVIVRRLGGKSRPRRPRKKWLQQKHPLPVAAD